MKKAILFQKLKKKVVECGVCQWRCLISPGKRGQCQTRLNKKGELYSLIYGLIYGGIQIDPIEKKPLYHLCPGTYAASIGSYGCNFRCRQCLNWSASWGPSAANIGQPIDFESLRPEHLSPQEFIGEVKKIRKANPLVKGIAFTYNEPTIWLEYVLDASKLAKKAGLYTAFVTNGYLTKEALDLIGPFIDGYAVDFKGFSDETYQRQGAAPNMGEIPEMAERAKKRWRMDVEITTLIIPTINDDRKELEEMAEWMVRNLGKDTPWHLSQFDPLLAPDEKFSRLPFTQVDLLQKIAQMGREKGLDFVYVWAPHSGPLGYYQEGDTACPKCGKLVVRRTTLSAETLNVDAEGRCKTCGRDLNIIAK